MPIRIAIIVSHPIQYFAPWYREMACVQDLELKVFFCCDWGVKKYADPGFKTELSWDVPLLEGYAHEFLARPRPLQRMTFWDVDNPSVGEALNRFQPDVVTVFGYACRTNWRVAFWARRYRRPLLLYSDSNSLVTPSWWKRVLKSVVVKGFYRYVDGALFIGQNNRAYHASYGIPEDRLFPGVYPIERRRLLEAVANRAATRKDVRRSLGIPVDTFVVLFCGKYLARKRPMDVLVAVNSLVRKGLSVWALLVGEGEQRPAMEAFCQRENFRNVSFTGFVNQSSVPSYYAASDVIAVTSSFEAYGLVATEASVFGLPIVVSNRVGCIGSRDTAQPGQNAIVFPCGDTQRLAQAVEMLYGDRKLYACMSAHSMRVSESQDELVASRQMASAVRQLSTAGPRSRNLPTPTKPAEAMSCAEE
ncbi:MAG TPA: glycosyltransferase family 4 protein [Terriglobales bacterium]|jgi:glycosyltransferase involved in cell wall biosynthesis|nr:glycosyltransferase family 4 protein [Terriglobales bacterium]